jgi:hypothetical protein
MNSTLSSQWQQTQLVELGGGWYQLCHIPSKSLGSTIARLFALNAKRISVPDPCTVKFSAGSSSELVQRLKEKFPVSNEK